MTKYLHIGLIVLAFLLAGSCTASKRYVSFEVLHPSPLTYPEYVQNIAFLNRAPISLYSFAKANQRGLEDVNSLMIIDTMICQNIVKGFYEGKAVNEQSYYNYVQDLKYRRRDTLGRADTMTPTMHEGFFSSYIVDAIISLEYYDVKLDQSRMNYDFETGRYQMEFRFVFELLWRVYEKENIEAVDEFRQVDTLYYLNHSDMKADEILSSADILRDGAGEFGYQYGLRIVPLWSEISRMLFTGREEALLVAAKMTDSGDWLNAKDIWLKASLLEDQKLSAKALHNLSIYYEMEDDLDKALVYSDEALKKWDSEFLNGYNADLRLRIKNKEVLLKQVR